MEIPVDELYEERAEELDEVLDEDIKKELGAIVEKAIHNTFQQNRDVLEERD